MFRKIWVLFFVMSLYLSASSILESEYSEHMIKASQKYAMYACLANRIYDEGESTVGKTRICLNTTWVLTHYISQSNGFQAGLYHNPKTNKYIISIGGTTANPKGLGTWGKRGGSILDVGTDILLLSNYNLIHETQSKSAIDYRNHPKVKNKKIGAIVGHSLGGGLAAYAGLYYGIDTYTFNPSPIPITNKSLDLFVKNQALTITGKTKDGKITNISFPNSNKITNIMSGDDPVSNISFVLEINDAKYYNATNGSTKWNFYVKNLAMKIPKELHLDYANQGNNIWFSELKTGHSMDALEENMRNAKEIGDYNAYIKKWAYLSKKVRKLQKVGFEATDAMDSTWNYNQGIVFDDYYPTKKASQRVAIGDVRRLYNKAMGFDSFDNNIDFINFLGLTGKIDIPKDRLEEMQNVDTGKYDDYISYKEYMLIVEATYKKIFGGQSFFSNIRRKSKSYLVFNKRYTNYADSSMRSIYGHIFILHFVGGTPKWYLQNDSQELTNSFVINFFSRFYANVLKYKNKIKRN